ncbi:MAG TPA: type II toxin-antitoxin system VapC family toxin [Solirubrobacterales bacterium]|nr:type II toxin-antitoxin system VapC family toxin [Solirubrobacterales bacterium]
MKKAEPKKPEAVLDASALLAHIYEERGAHLVGKAIDSGAAISVVNWIEVLSRLADDGEDPELASEEITADNLVKTTIRIEPVTARDAIEAARLRPLTRGNGLSLADRTCLVLGKRLSVPVLTADREWTGLGDISGSVKLIR